MGCVEKPAFFWQFLDSRRLFSGAHLYLLWKAAVSFNPLSQRPPASLPKRSKRGPDQGVLFAVGDEGNVWSQSMPCHLELRNANI